METLKALAAEGHTVVCSLHQPRSSIFALLDDLILLSNGQVDVGLHLRRLHLHKHLPR